MKNNTPWAESAIKLLKGPIYKNRDKRDVWNQLIDWRENIDEYYGILNLRIHIDEVDGYAYLEQIEDAVNRGMEEEEEESTAELPRLIRRQSLSYNQSMLLVLIRSELSKFDSSSADGDVLILKKSDIVDLYNTFAKSYADQNKTDKIIDQAIRSFIKLTFLFDDKKAASEAIISDEAEFEVSPIIKAKVDINLMKELLMKMEAVAKNEKEADYE